MFTLSLVSAGWGKEKALKLCKHCSVMAKNQCVISTVLAINAKHSTTGTAVKEGNANLARLSTILNKRSCT